MDTYPHRRSLIQTSIRAALGLGALAPLLVLAAGTASADAPDGTYDVETPLGQIGRVDDHFVRRRLRPDQPWRGVQTSGSRHEHWRRCR